MDSLQATVKLLIVTGALRAAEMNVVNLWTPDNSPDASRGIPSASSCHHRGGQQRVARGMPCRCLRWPEARPPRRNFAGKSLKKQQQGP